jgi:hypothetical protein
MAFIDTNARLVKLSVNVRRLRTVRSLTKSKSVLIVTPIGFNARKMGNAIYKEIRADGWPLCPQCEEDELYSALMLAYDGKGEPPSLEKCLANEMCCYLCDWSSNLVFPACFNCGKLFEADEWRSPAGKQYIHCLSCRGLLKTNRIREEVARMDWPDVIQF